MQIVRDDKKAVRLKLQKQEGFVQIADFSRDTGRPVVIITGGDEAAVKQFCEQYELEPLLIEKTKGGIAAEVQPADKKAKFELAEPEG